MKILWSLFILSTFVFSSPVSAESRNCTGSVMMGVGPQSGEQKCRAGDIVKLPIKRIAELCDFKSAIACNGEAKRSLCYCVLKQKRRKLR